MIMNQPIVIKNNNFKINKIDIEKIKLETNNKHVKEPNKLIFEN